MRAAMLGRGNDTPQTSTIGSATEEWVRRLERYSDADLDRRARQWEREQAQLRQAKLRECWRLLVASAGRRYEHCTLSNYQAETPAQRRVVAALATYGDDMRARAANGQNVILYGPSGTGKDHLLCGLARRAIWEYGLCVHRISGPALFRVLRDAIDSKAAESRVLAPCRTADVLLLSDPLPPTGNLTDWQAAVLYDVVDYRYGRKAPIWCALNVADAAEANRRLTPAILDRLRDGALVLNCHWRSWRKASETA